MEETPGIKTKRHSVLALFEGIPSEFPRSQEWVEITKERDTLPAKSCHVVVKRRDGRHANCAFWHDKHPLLIKHGYATSHFQDLETYHFLHDVTHWKYLETPKVK